MTDEMHAASTATQPRTGWMWVDGNGEVFGLAIDEQTHLLRWYANPGCACSNESAADQSLAQYRQRGVPGQVAEPPADVLAEIEETVRMLQEAPVPGKARVGDELAMVHG